MWVEVNIIIEKGAGWIDVDRAERSGGWCR